MAGWNERCPKPGHGAKLWLVIILVVALMAVATAAGWQIDEPGMHRARSAAATLTVAAGEFHAQLTAMAAEGDCVPMPCQAP